MNQEINKAKNLRLAGEIGFNTGTLGYSPVIPAKTFMVNGQPVARQVTKEVAKAYLFGYLQGVQNFISDNSEEASNLESAADAMLQQLDTQPEQTQTN